MDAGRAADLYDAVVVGGGPAGLAAALYLARARYRVLVVEKDTFGGQITITAEVVNYPGVEKTEGHSLTETMRRQALHFGAEFLLAEAQGIDVDGDFRIVRTSRGAFRCFAVLLATGAHPRKVGFEGEETFRGRGVAYCATCDGGFFTDRDVFVVGGGFAAAEEAMFLTRYARSVTMLVRRSTLSCAESIAEQVLAHESVRVRFNTVLEAVEGDTALRRAVFRDTVTGRLETYAPPEGETFGVFVFAGYEPASRLAEGLAELTGQGNIVTDREQRTRTEGVYAAGDVCDKRLRQVVTAVSDGAVAATSIERYAADMQRKTGLRPQRPATAPASSGASKASAPSGNARETEGGFLTAEQREQLAGVFARMERPLILKAEPDSRPVSEDLRRMLMELAALTDKLTVEWTPPSDGPERPCVRVLRADGTDTGIAFHGVPGGHEFNSFVGPRAEHRSRPCRGHRRHRQAAGSANRGCPVLHHVPGTGHSRAEDRRLQSAGDRQGLRREPLPGTAGTVQDHERALPHHQQGESSVRQEDARPVVGIAGRTGGRADWLIFMDGP